MHQLKQHRSLFLAYVTVQGPGGQVALLHRITQGPSSSIMRLHHLLGVPSTALSWLPLTGRGQKAWNGRPWLGKSTSHFPPDATGGLGHMDKPNCKGSWEIQHSNSATCPAKEAGKCSAAGQLPAHHCSITVEEGNIDSVVQ